MIDVEELKEMKFLLHKFNFLFNSNLAALPYLNIVSKTNVNALVADLQYRSSKQIFISEYKSKYIEHFSFTIEENKLEHNLKEVNVLYKACFNKYFTRTDLYFGFYGGFIDKRFIEAIKINSSESLFELLTEEQKRAFEIKTNFSGEPFLNRFNAIRLHTASLNKRIKNESKIEVLYSTVTMDIARIFNETYEHLRNEFLKCGIEYFSLNSPYEPF